MLHILFQNAGLFSQVWGERTFPFTARAHLHWRREVLCVTSSANDGALRWLVCPGASAPAPWVPPPPSEGAFLPAALLETLDLTFTFLPPSGPHRRCRGLDRLRPPPSLARALHFSRVFFRLLGAHCTGRPLPKPPPAPGTSAPPSDSRCVRPSIPTPLCCPSFRSSPETSAPSWAAILP